MSKAEVYLWPFLDKTTQVEREVECVFAGYRHKEYVEVKARKPMKVIKVT